MRLRKTAMILSAALLSILSFFALSYAETLPQGVDTGIEAEAKDAESEAYKKGLLDKIVEREKEAPEAVTQQSERSTFKDELQKDKIKQRTEDMDKEKENMFDYKQRGLYY